MRGIITLATTEAIGTQGRRSVLRLAESFRTTGPCLMQNQFARPGMANRLSSHAKFNYGAEAAAGLSGEGLRKLAKAPWEECHD